MTLSEIAAFHGLTATATPTGTNVGGTDQIGEVLTRSEFPTADIAFSVLVADAGTDTATLQLGNGVLSGSADTKTDGDGKDFEGVTLPTVVTIYAIQFVAISGATAIACSASGMPDFSLIASGNLLWTAPAGAAVGSDTITITPSASTVEITVIGKSS